MFKLDGKDRSILRILEEDGRAQVKIVAKKTGIPRDSVQYRIKRMQREGVLKGIVPICDTNKLGYPVYTYVHIQLQQYNMSIEKKFMHYLKEHKNIIYVAKVIGDFHYILCVVTKDIQELDVILRTLIATFPGMIKNYNTSLLVEEVQYDSFYKLID